MRALTNGASMIQKRRLSAISDLLAKFGTIHKVLGGLYHFSNFGWNPFTTFL